MEQALRMSCLHACVLESVSVSECLCVCVSVYWAMRGQERRGSARWKRKEETAASRPSDVDHSLNTGFPLLSN